ncbi:hypothetical protein B0H14DRAFT_2352469 [Mycena olivaceomarginata]|nr:hypothetical protein B0H14DRAFT_2352469 [Mycena olivaceomarginata]
MVLYSETTLSRVTPGSIARNSLLLDDLEDKFLRLGLLKYYNRDRPKVHFSGQETATTVDLRPHADFYKYALLDGRRLAPTTESRRNTAGSSLIQVRYHDLPFAGEIGYIFRHEQTGVVDFESPEILVRVAWMKTTNFTPLDNVTLWNDL